MRFRVVSAALALLITAALAAPNAVAQTGAPSVPDHIRGFSIVPPGQDGTVTAEEFFSSQAGSGDFGPHYEDQLDMYASLVEDGDVSDDELSEYFHSMQFGPQGAIERTYSPADGVTVFRDEFGIPHIYADSLQNASFALGYVSAEDRLFQMDIFRHAARGTLTELLGSGGQGKPYLAMDIATRREGYTEDEITKMYEDLDEKFGATGTLVQDGLQAYAEGVTQFIDEARIDPSVRPVEYEATGNPTPVFPTEWNVNDTLFLVVLQLRVFGETAGQELDNAGMLFHLQEKHGKRKGLAIFNDLAFQNDPTSYTSVRPEDGRFPSQNLGEINWKSVAIPDHADSIAQGLRAQQRQRTRLLASLGFRAPASNALLVGASQSATGNPLEIGAPQVGYANPAFFIDIDVHAPGVDFRGPAVPGASALIPLGRGRDYAWSLTTGMSDAVDVRVEKLCDPEGGTATLNSNAYLFNGECKAMEERTETFLIKPQPTVPEPPEQREETFYRTLHGPVFGRGSVDGDPVAFVKERFFWKKEIDSVPSFLRWNSQVRSIGDFAAAAETFTMSFNAFYADAEHIGYFHVGHYPRRVRGQHPSLPTWGTGKWEWQGRVPFSSHPKVIDPKQGWVVNWNNKPSSGWKNYDNLKFGRIHRVNLLKDRMHQLLDGDGQATLSDLVDVIRDAATRDPRAVYLGPRMVRMVGTSDVWPQDGRNYTGAVSLVRRWVVDGSHRTNADRDETMDRSAELMLFDAWYDNLVRGIFDDEIGKDSFNLVPAPVTDYTPAGGSSFWFDFSSYLINLFDPKTRGTFAWNYCDDITTDAPESCALQARRALVKAVQTLAGAHGNDFSTWTKAAENIEFSDQGIGSVTPIPWQNRGTHNHVVEILSDAG